ncbi:PIN domain-containing protein [Cyanobium sp. AMD-g]|nr:PIN domain-containing protein [Cyanobium sp. AMD-g]
MLRWLDDQDVRQVWLPSVVLFELRYGTAIHPDGKRRQALEQGLNQLMEQLIQERVAPLDGVAAQKAAQLAARRKALGRPVDLRDTLIAGIALAHGAGLATGNGRHFRDTTIGLIDPFSG